MADPDIFGGDSGFTRNDRDIFGDEPVRKSTPPRKKEPESPTSFGNLMGAAVEPNITLATSALGSIPAGWAGILGGLLPGPAGQAGDWTRSVQNKLTYSPQTVGGQNAMKVIGAPFELLAKGAHAVGGGATDLTGSPLAGAVLDTAVNMAPALLGARYAPPVEGGILGTVASAPFKAVRNVFGTAEGNAGRIVNHLSGEQAPGILASLQNARLGETAGQAAVPAGSAEFSALQRMAEQRDPSKYGSAGIEGAQEAQRQSMLGAIAGTPQQLDIAIGARNAVTGPMRDANLGAANQGGGQPLPPGNNNLPITSQISNMRAAAPGVRSAPIITELEWMLNQPGQRASDVVSRSLGAIRQKIESLTDANGVINAHDLYTVRKELGNTIGQFAKETANWDKRLTGGLQRDVQGAFDSAIEGAGGTTWRDYLTRYGQMSEPINRMQTGQTLLDALRTPVGTAERPATFAGAVNKAAQDPSYATGKPRMSDLTQADQAAIAEIRGELARDARLQTLATEGMPNAARQLGFTMPTAPTTGFLNAKVTIGRSIYNHLVGRATDKAMKFLAENMDNPQVIAQILGDQMPPILSTGQQTMGQFPLYGGSSAGILSTRE